MHKIRLKKPWEKTTNLAKTRVRVDVPEQPQGAATSHIDATAAVETATYRRRFNRPTGLQPSTRVWLNIRDFAGRLEFLSVNQRQFQALDAPVELDIHDALSDHNELVITLSATDGAQPSLSGDVWLAIDDKP